MTTGGGHARLSVTMSVLGVPVMAKNTVIQTENDIGELYLRLTNAMVEAGREEKRLAEEKGNCMREYLP